MSTLYVPVSAAPTAAAGTEEDGSGSSSGNGGSAPSGLTAHGDPSLSSLTVLEHDARHALLELRTGGFYTRPRSDGTLEVQIPGFESTARPGAPDLPTRSTWIDAIAGRRVLLTSVLPRTRCPSSTSGLLRPGPRASRFPATA